MGEFELIDRHFKRKPAIARIQTAPTATNSIANPVVLGIGDDCALLQPAPGTQLAVSTDMLVQGRHFFADVDPAALGHKALAVNLSDLAACGAEPLACTLALALPPERARDDAWLAALAGGLWALADAQRCPLVGGDTTAGPLNLCLTVFGQVPAGQALRRDGARVGDDVWVSGTLGDARLALEVFRGRLALPAEAFEHTRRAMECPQPRVALGRALRGLARSAIDLSDGLLGDLGHILRRSGVSARLERDRLPTSAWLAAQPEALQRQCLLAGGDDYELLFTAPAGRGDEVARAAREAGVPVTRIGRIVVTPGLACHGPDGAPLAVPHGYEHFKPGPASPRRE